MRAALSALVWRTSSIRMTLNCARVLAVSVMIGLVGSSRSNFVMEQLSEWLPSQFSMNVALGVRVLQSLWSHRPYWPITAMILHLLRVQPEEPPVPVPPVPLPPVPVPAVPPVAVLPPLPGGDPIPPVPGAPPVPGDPPVPLGGGVLLLTTIPDCTEELSSQPLTPAEQRADIGGLSTRCGPRLGVMVTSRTTRVLPSDATPSERITIAPFGEGAPAGTVQFNTPPPAPTVPPSTPAVWGTSSHL